MAEMTAEKAVEWLTSDKAFGQECYSRKQIAALIEQQAQEIAKKDRMIEKAIDKLFILPDRDECPDDGDCYCLPRQKEQRDPDIGDCRKCWLACLEKETEGQP